MVPSFKYLIVSLFFVLLVGNTQAQSGVVNVIDGSAQPYYYYGITSYYFLGYNQYLYTPAQINNIGPISAIQLHSNVDLTPINPVKIYMGETIKQNFSTRSDWVRTGLTLVYDGPVDVSVGWNTITLDNSFLYNNASNLLICIDSDEAGDGAGGSSASKGFFTDGIKYLEHVLCSIQIEDNSNVNMINHLVKTYIVFIQLFKHPCLIGL